MKTLGLGGDAWVVSLYIVPEWRDVPDLVVLEILQGYTIQPFQLLEEILSQREQDLCSIDPKSSAPYMHSRMQWI